MKLQGLIIIGSDRVMKNESFDIKRFGALFVRYWAENKVVYLLTMVIVLLLMGWGAADWYYVIGVFLPLSIIFQLSIVFKDWTNAKKTELFMLVPAAKSEKFALLLLMGVILPGLFLIGTAYIVEHVRLFLHSGIWNIDFTDMGPNYMEYRTIAVTFVCLSIFLGCFIFRRQALLYSAVISILTFNLGVNVLDKWLGHLLVHKKWDSWAAFSGFQMRFSDYKMIIDNGLLFDFPYISFPLLGLFFIGMIYAAYLKFSEKQLKA